VEEELGFLSSNNKSRKKKEKNSYPPTLSCPTFGSQLKRDAIDRNQGWGGGWRGLWKTLIRTKIELVERLKG
jgi:hypothetical protein